MFNNYACKIVCHINTCVDCKQNITAWWLRHLQVLHQVLRSCQERAMQSSKSGYTKVKFLNNLIRFLPPNSPISVLHSSFTDEGVLDLFILLDPLIFASLSISCRLISPASTWCRRDITSSSFKSPLKIRNLDGGQSGFYWGLLRLRLLKPFGLSAHRLQTAHILFQ